MQTSEMEARLNFSFFFFSLENITAITILWGRMIKCKLAYRLVLGGREKERWVKILKIMYSYAAQRHVQKSSRFCCT